MAHFNQNFLDSIERDLPSHLSMEDFIAYSNKPLRLSIRVNTLKISSDDFIDLMTQKGWHFDPIPWCKDGFWVTLNQEIQLGNTIEHLQGLFYIQEASSMLPPTALLEQLETTKTAQTCFDNLFENSVVLDMASAPGSKTTQIAALMHNQGLLIANEYSASRVKVLHANVARMGVANCALTHFDARVFGEYMFETFDSILLDAPCSGEGTIRKDPDALKNWDNNDDKGIVDTQKALIESAFLALKVGGSLVYSTCALSRQENQDVCHHLKSLYGDAVEFGSLATLFPQADKACTEEGFLHVWPQIFDSEGFFVAKIHKISAVERQQPEPKKQKNFPFSLAKPKQVEELAQYFKDTFSITLPDNAQMMVRDLEYWLFPNPVMPLIGKMRFQRIGIKLADALKKGYKVRHEAVLALSSPTRFELSDEQAKEFLMGRDISLQEKVKPQGEVIVSYANNSLGVAKHLGNKLKNNLPRDLVKDKIALYSHK
ncbi:MULTISPECIES: 16S rRNA (cytosine(1407)-C(5))-methyltransferase RsmF [unclassified Shewanella]|uniref:16S rRNA (cytosine(1407)-C(5))-methyltransferase RsmF n=1 Tax=unclassified Shewanella TaxID=196818 RepID=UPI001BC3767D|nr:MULTISPECIES: 16S rRNA (cytosine(1407)-C(5))-methyltransferase RsmF [unclassified Shewanella]GIU07447.1 ribosomal RNA small subunit methyltransferase F [Shewanella sp. MBTL60-112-B1]GIU39584.1 ribosomal RNA small subunit methyltransferase F [Shewanella sp. MBTL60-112-B2]